MILFLMRKWNDHFKEDIMKSKTNENQNSTATLGLEFWIVHPNTLNKCQWTQLFTRSCALASIQTAFRTW